MVPPPALLLPFESQKVFHRRRRVLYNSITSCHAGQVNTIVTQRREIDQFNVEIARLKRVEHNTTTVS